MGQDLPVCENPNHLPGHPRVQMRIDREEAGKFVTLVCPIADCQATHIITNDNYKAGIRREVLRRRRLGQGGLERPKKYFHG